jgi:pimeloyl-ACP methyl ester carboxylesterase
MRRTKLAILALATFAALLSGLVPAVAGPDPNTEQGAINGANFIIQMPAGTWNQTLVLYSHGYVPPGSPLNATDAPAPATGQWLLDHGYAIAGSSYRTNGWAIEQALPDQIALLDHFKAEHSALKRTVAWGESLGGMITAGLIQNYPNRFAGALPMCGVVAGGVGVWNSGLDAEFVLATLVAHDPALQLVNITNTGFGPGSNFDLAEKALLAAQASDQGKARIALAAAIADTPGWFSPSSAEPAANDFVTRRALLRRHRDDGLDHRQARL